MKNTSEKVDANSQEYGLQEIHQLERRRLKLSGPTHYEKLSLAQQYSASKLHQYGYQLMFIRGKGSDAFAIFLCKEKMAIVNLEGEITLSTDIMLRGGSD